MRFCTRVSCRAPLEEGRKDKFCKACRAAYTRDYAARHPERARAATKKWAAANRDKLRVTEAAYWAAHPEEKKAKRHRWYEKHGKEYRAKKAAEARALRVPAPERLPTVTEKRAKNAAKMRKYRAKHGPVVNAKQRASRVADPVRFSGYDKKRYAKDPEKRVALHLAIRAKRAGAIGSYTRAEWDDLLRRHGYVCHYCNAALTTKTFSRDHIVPLSGGGSHTIDNIVPCCRSCNSRKCTMTAEEFRLHLSS